MKLQFIIQKLWPISFYFIFCDGKQLSRSCWPSVFLRICVSAHYTFCGCFWMSDILTLVRCMHVLHVSVPLLGEYPFT